MGSQTPAFTSQFLIETCFLNFMMEFEKKFSNKLQGLGW